MTKEDKYILTFFLTFTLICVITVICKVRYRISQSYKLEQHTKYISAFAKNSQNIAWEFIKKQEEFKPSPYEDSNFESIGYGTRAKGRRSITEKEAEKEARETIEIIYNKINDRLGNPFDRDYSNDVFEFTHKYNTIQIAMMISWAYNTGLYRFFNTKTWQLIIDREPIETIAEEWNKGHMYTKNKKQKAGVVKRRAIESMLITLA